MRNDIEYLFASVGKILLLSFENDNKAMSAVTAIAYYDDFKNLIIDSKLFTVCRLGHFSFSLGL